MQVKLILYLLNNYNASTLHYFIIIILMLHHISTVPGPPENFNVTPINYTTVFLSWDRAIEENGIVLFYTITYNGSRIEKQPVCCVFLFIS